MIVMVKLRKGYPIGKKKCTVCDTVKFVSSFYSFRRKGKGCIEHMCKCKECHKQFQKKYAKKVNFFRKDNALRCREYRMKHPERYRAQKRRYIRNRRKNDTTFLIKDRISTQVYQFCKRINVEKTNSFWSSIDYEPKELKEQLELQFWYGMDWDNYGDWHIDHIKPKSKFQIDEYGDDQFYECWALSNMQPLWKEDNLLKGSTFYEDL